MIAVTVHLPPIAGLRNREYSVITFGCNIQSTRRFADDVRFATAHNVHFFQLGYTADGFLLHPQDTPDLAASMAFPLSARRRSG